MASQWFPRIIAVFKIIKGISIAEFQSCREPFTPGVIQTCNLLVPEQRVGQHFVG